jgi:putative transposase
LSALNRTFKYRLYPTRQQTQRFEQTLAVCQELYNAALQERRDAWKCSRLSVRFAQPSEQLPAIKVAHSAGVYAQVLQDVLRRVDKAFKAFFRRLQRGAKPGFPRFRSHARYDSFTYPQFGFAVQDGRLVLSKLGAIKIKLHRPLEGQVKTCTVKREAGKCGKWYVCFSCEVEPARLPASSKAIGVDLGVESFAVLSDGTAVDNPRQYRQAEAKLRRAQRKVARRKKGSHRRRKAVRELQKVHLEVRNQRADFHHKVARWLVAMYGVIVVERLNVKGLASGRLAKSVQDAGWSAFLHKLAYKAESAGRELVKVDPQGTSQRCICGRPVPKTLSERWHRCRCGLSMSRDQAAALEILRLGRSLQAVSTPPGSTGLRSPRL